jgi:hypothetical protein
MNPKSTSAVPFQQSCPSLVPTTLVCSLPYGFAFSRAQCRDSLSESGLATPTHSNDFESCSRGVCVTPPSCKSVILMQMHGGSLSRPLSLLSALFPVWTIIHRAAIHIHMYRKYILFPVGGCLSECVFNL